jgi:hypothetical protein
MMTETIYRASFLFVPFMNATGLAGHACAYADGADPYVYDFDPKNARA